MEELRTGVKLRKTDHVKRNQEFSMTPYELLMQDIKSSNKRMLLNSHKRLLAQKPKRDLPEHVETAARDKIMTYIKSKPKLKPASERKLAELILKETPAEKLLSEIRRGKTLRDSRRERRKEPKRLHEKTSPRKSLKEQMDKKERKFIAIDDALQSSLLNFDSSPDNSADEGGALLSCEEDHSFGSSHPDTSQEDRLGRSLPDEDLNEDSVFNDSPLSPIPSPRAKKSITLKEYGLSRNQMVLAGIDWNGKYRDREMEDFKEGKVCTQCQETRFAWYRKPWTCYVCQHKVCNNDQCYTKVKFPTKDPSEIMLASLTIERVSLDTKASYFSERLGFSRRSLRAPSSRQEGQRLSRSKTLSKVEARALGAQARGSKQMTAGHFSLQPVCLDCDRCLDDDIQDQRNPDSGRMESSLTMSGKV